MSAAPNAERTLSHGRALVPFRPVRGHALPWPSFRQALLVVGFGLALGVGAASFQGARHAVVAWTAATRTPAQPDAQTAMLNRLQAEVGRLQSSVEALRSASESTKSDDQLRGLRRSVDALKQNVEQIQSSGTANVAQLAAKIDKVDRDPSPKLAEIAARLDRVADLAGRVDRVEKQVAASAPTGLIPAGSAPRPAAPIVAAKPAPVTAAAPAKPEAAAVPTPAAKPTVAKPVPVAAAPAKPEVTQVPAATPKTADAAKPPTLGGWVLRDVYDGMALVQARGGGMREVEPGEYLPGAGEVRSIERRGHGWVILTSRGMIDSSTF